MLLNGLFVESAPTIVTLDQTAYITVLIGELGTLACASEGRLIIVGARDCLRHGTSSHRWLLLLLGWFSLLSPLRRCHLWLISDLFVALFRAVAHFRLRGKWVTFILVPCTCVNWLILLLRLLVLLDRRLPDRFDSVLFI